MFVLFSILIAIAVRGNDDLNTVAEGFAEIEYLLSEEILRCSDSVAP